MSTTLVLVSAAAAAVAAVLVWPSPQRPRWTLATPRPSRQGPAEDAATGAEVPRSPAAGAGVRALRRPSGSPHASLVPEALELVALALAGGSSVASAARTVADTLPGRLGDELAAVAEALRRGEDAASAWAAAGPHWSTAQRSLDLAEGAGIPPADALVQGARDLRRDAVADVETASARLGVRLVVPLGLFYLPAFVLTTVTPVVLALTSELGW